MDEVNVHIQQQSSISSDSALDDAGKTEHTVHSQEKRICLVGEVTTNPAICNTAQKFRVPVVTSERGLEYTEDRSCTTIFVISSFESDVFNILYKSRQPLLGPPALQQLSDKNEKLPDNTRPLFNLAMSGVVVCFTGFRNKEDLTKLVPLVHHMGGSIRKEMSAKVTHLIANASGGDKYQYAATFRVPVVHQKWVLASWEHRNDITFSAALDSFVVEHKLKPFHGARVCFMGFPEEEEKHMTEVLEANGGCVTNSEDPCCTHVVMDPAETYTLEPASLQPSPKVVPNYISPIISNLTTPSDNKPNMETPKLTVFNTSFTKKAARNTPLLETVHENSHNLTNTNSSKRKRKKALSPDSSIVDIKRRCDISCSEKGARIKISNFFRTPINYISNRRRTIGESSINQSLNESIVSSSGIFNIETIENLNVTPTASKNRHNSVKKNLFTRTFSSTRFSKNWDKLKKPDLNSTRSSEYSECDGRSKLNTSCFPDILSHPCELEPGAHFYLKNFGSSLPGVVDESSVQEKPEASSRAQIVKAEWFWTSVQKELSLDEKEYLFDDYIEQVLSPNTRRDSHQATPSSASRRKRKRFQETLSSLAHQPSPALHKRRSSVSDAGLLSVSGSFLDYTASPDKGIIEDAEPSPADAPRKAVTPRQQVFLELLETESNYVKILRTIILMFKKHLEDMLDEEALLNNTELKIIFGNVPPIYETHVKMLNELHWLSVHWTEDRSIGNIILKYSTDLLKAYPPFVNFFEEMKDMLLQCDTSKPRFHAFLKACQTRPECGRQPLQDLLIRPVQRLPSISLLLNDILKNTPKTNADHAALDQALAAVREVMTHINEDKRKTEGQRVMFDIFNDIESCPPELISSHRSFVARTEVIQLSSSEGLSSKGNPLVLFLFTDQLEVCKKRSKAFNSMKSPNTVNGFHQKSTTKPYKHVKLMPLSTIKRVIDIKETDECQKVFSIVFRNNDELKERLFSFVMTEDDADKATFLKTLCRQMANNACTADADKFLAYLEPHQLDIDTSDINTGTLSKAFKFATRTRLKVGRAFSFNKTPSKLKRAVSSMMSPFGSSTNLTPASQLAQMKLASYTNLTELGDANNVPNESQPIAPMSVQPTRKMKSSSMGVNALKRL